MKSELENKLIAVVRVRGRVGVRRTISETLSRLNLRKPNNMVLLFGNRSNLGMIRKCSDFVTYGVVNTEVLERILTKKGIKVSKEDLSAVVSGKKPAREVMETPIRMHPPRRGYEGTKVSFGKGGALGYRGEKINELIGRMA